MKKILVLGTCSCCCGKTEKLIRTVAQKNNVKKIPYLRSEQE